MILKDRVIAFEKLQNIFKKFHNTYFFQNLVSRAELNNSWFTDWNIKYAFYFLSQMLSHKELIFFVNSYKFSNQRKKIGVIIPSNIPLVGFHDLLCVLLSGNIFIGKLSFSNNVLLPFVSDLLFEIDVRFRDFIFFEKSINKIDYLIATGNDNSADYFNSYFNNTKKIIRKHRNSVAVLVGDETHDDYKKLFNDIFMYFGLGCRSVSKLFIPYGFDFNRLRLAFDEKFKSISHTDYLDNYNYQKSILIINNSDFIDFDNILLIESNQLDSPISVLYYQYYDNISSVHKQISLNRDKIQCVISNEGVMSNSIKFGYAQKPTLWDFPNGVDVMSFLQSN